MSARRTYGRFLLGLLLVLGISLGLFYGLMQPPLGDLSLMTSFLAVTVALAAAAGFLAHRLRWFDRSPSLRLSLLLIHLLASGLVFASVWVTARLMFASQHDLLLATVLLLFAAGMAAVLGIYLSSRIIDRIRELEAIARRIGDGDLTVRAPVQGDDELASLSRAFNLMALQLESAATRQAELERNRRDLVAWAGHDLQTPLTSIRAILEALADGVIEDPAAVQRYLQTARRNVQDVSRLIDDLFEVAQLQAGSFRLARDEVSLRDLTSDALESFSEQAARRGIHMTGTVAAGVDPVVLDPARIGRVLANLLSNALRHTPEGGRITIEATAVSEDVRVAVSDTGEGIPPEDLPHVFESFYRGASAGGRPAGSLGLGLAIARAFVEAHGGQITAINRPQGGCTLAFTLPRHPAHLSPNLPARAISA